MVTSGLNGFGWNNTDVAFGFTPGDTLSGVAGTSILSPLVLSAEGASVAGAVTVTDLAGNAAAFGSPSVRIDKTAPNSPTRRSSGRLTAAPYRSTSA